MTQTQTEVLLSVRGYEFEMDHWMTIRLPEGARILKVDAPDDIPCLWALIDPFRTPKPKTFAIYRTGETIHRFTPLGAYVATFQHGTHAYYMFEEDEG